MTAPGVGDYMVVKTGGWFARGIRWATHSPVNHAAVYIGRGFIVEAQPGGARVTPASRYGTAIWSHRAMEVQTRQDIAHAAFDFVGTPYNFLDIAAQAIVRIFHWKAPKWALKRLSNSHYLQCAQLVDAAYAKAGVQLFPDGRPAGMCSPEDLRRLIVEQDELIKDK